MIFLNIYIQKKFSTAYGLQHNSIYKLIYNKTKYLKNIKTIDFKTSVLLTVLRIV